MQVSSFSARLFPTTPLLIFAFSYKVGTEATFKIREIRNHSKDDFSDSRENTRQNETTDACTFRLNAASSSAVKSLFVKGTISRDRFQKVDKN